MSLTSYGSTLKDNNDVNNLPKNHPQWEALRSRLKYGAVFPTSKMTKEVRKNDSRAAVERGNQKSSIKNEELL